MEMKETSNEEDELKGSEERKKRIKLDVEEDEIDHELSGRSRPHLYENKTILAPMVRANSLPFRLVCLKNGADLVYSEELIDHRVITCKRIVNNLLGTIDFVDKDNRVIFRTCSEERGRIVFQLGSNDPDRALKAAKLVSQDVSGIDFNFGCPKNFSIAGGMGAALLEQPEKIRKILTHCVRNLDIPVTCKMRILPNLVDTINLVKLIESCGVSAIAVHGRTKDQRPKHENNIEVLRKIAETISIPLIANGESNNIKTYDDMMKFRIESKASSVMIARAAMLNPGIFRNMKISDNVSESADIRQVVEEYLKFCVIYDNHPSNVKYSLQRFMSFKSDFGKPIRFHEAKNLKEICDAFKMSDWFEENNKAKATM